MTTTTTVPAPTGTPRLILRLEALAVLALSATSYFALGGSPWLFALLFFAPDLSFFGYTAGPRIGAIAYNTVHSYLLPATLLAIGWVSGTTLLIELGLILAAHIGFDRSLGYGLKYVTAFNMTHLGRVGQK